MFILVGVPSGEEWHLAGTFSLASCRFRKELVAAAKQ
jgi:hypothetical protein